VLFPCRTEPREPLGCGRTSKTCRWLVMRNPSRRSPGSPRFALTVNSKAAIVTATKQLFVFRASRERPLAELAKNFIHPVFGRAWRIRAQPPGAIPIKVGLRTSMHLLRRTYGCEAPCEGGMRASGEPWIAGMPPCFRSSAPRRPECGGFGCVLSALSERGKPVVDGASRAAGSRTA
jgi:hypothetical protein